MRVIQSGTSTERIIRTAILVTLSVGFSIAFFWDGHVGYPRENLEKLVESLGLQPVEPSVIKQNLTRVKGLQIAKDTPASAEFATVVDAVGEVSLEKGDDAYFVGPGGYLRVTRDANRVASIRWAEPTHTQTDLQVQIWFGYLLGVVGLCFIAQFLRVITTRAVLSDSGLKLRGRAVIPLSAIQAVDPDPSGRTGCVLLKYDLNGTPRTVKLDRYVIGKLGDIVTAICDQRGFPNPLRVDAGAIDKDEKPADQPRDEPADKTDAT